jgi:anti-anti-sigma factor
MLQVTEREVGDVLILELVGGLGLNDGGLEKRIMDLASSGQKKFVVTNLRFQPEEGSAGLGVIVRSFNATKQKGGRLKLAATSKPATDLLDLTKLLPVFEIFDSEDEAVASFAR